jgi:hypothetical protein
MLPYYDEVFVNKVDADGEAEVFFPNLDNCPEFITHVLPVVEDEGYKTQLYIYRK